MIALIRQLARALTPTAWIALAVLAAFLIFGAYCAHRGAEGVRDRHAAEQAKTEAKASSARETAAATRATDTTIINAREKELSDAVSSLPDAAPSPRRVALACERLRQQGSRLPASCGPGR
ncbi:hypothetical protein [Brevundimonas sp.]|uniref:hypothetical protein n=1 Tax=Brevundimonas sp. TaxID=1871086 RepID=UPI002ED98964